MKYLFVLLSLLSACSPETKPKHPFKDDSHAFSERMGISTLFPNEVSEIRLWTGNGWAGGLQVTIVNESMLKECSVRETFNTTYYEWVQHMQCSEYSIGLHKEELEKLLAANIALDKQDISCFGIMDAEAGLIEGTYKGQWFAYRYETPDECETEAVLSLQASLVKFKTSLLEP